MSRYGAILNACRSITDRDAVNDLTAPCAAMIALLGLPERSFCPEMLLKSLFQYAARLDKQALINRFVRHMHGLVIRIAAPEPARDLLWGPVLGQLQRNDTP